MTETDGKVAPDFLFSLIKNVHFGGGDWFAVYHLPSADNRDNMSVAFPGQAGGTPGLTVLSRGATSEYHPAPYTVQTADLDHKITTSAGFVVTTFGVRNPLAAECLCFIQMPSQKAPFQVNVHLAATAGIRHFQPFTIATFTKGGIKKGYTVKSKFPSGILDPTSLVGGQVAQHISFLWDMTNQTFENFSIDPVSKVITDLGGG